MIHTLTHIWHRLGSAQSHWLADERTHRLTNGRAGKQATRVPWLVLHMLSPNNNIWQRVYFHLLFSKLFATPFASNFFASFVRFFVLLIFFPFADLYIWLVCKCKRTKKYCEPNNTWKNPYTIADDYSRRTVFSLPLSHCSLEAIITIKTRSVMHFFSYERFWFRCPFIKPYILICLVWFCFVLSCLSEFINFSRFLYATHTHVFACERASAYVCLSVFVLVAFIIIIGLISVPCEMTFLSAVFLFWLNKRAHMSQMELVYRYGLPNTRHKSIIWNWNWNQMQISCHELNLFNTRATHVR